MSDREGGNTIEERVLRLERNIARLQKENKRLRASEQKYRLIAENVIDVILIIDIADLTFSYASPSIEKLLGYTPDEMIGVSLNNLMTAETYDYVVHILNRQLVQESRGHTDPQTLQFKQRRKDGAEVWIEATTRFIRNEHREPVEIIGIARDLNDRKRIEREKIYSEKLQGVLEMAGAVCHELNQPMQALLGYCELIAMEIVENDPTLFKVQKIRDQIRRIEKFTAKLANITHYETRNYFEGIKIIDVDKASGAPKN